jgi:hypothetical protein
MIPNSSQLLLGLLNFEAALTVLMIIRLIKYTALPDTRKSTAARMFLKIRISSEQGVRNNSLARK